MAKITFGYLSPEGNWHVGVSTTDVDGKYLSGEAMDELIGLAILQMVQGDSEAYEQAMKDAQSNVVGGNFIPAEGSGDTPSDAEGRIIAETKFEVDGKPYYKYFMGFYEDSGIEFYTLLYISTQRTLD